MSAAVTLTAESRPGLSPHVRLKQDNTRGGWVLLGPERVLLLDKLAAEVLELCDGARSISEISDVLAARHSAPLAEVRGDVIEMLQNLFDKRFLTT